MNGRHVGRISAVHAVVALLAGCGDGGGDGGGTPWDGVWRVDVDAPAGGDGGSWGAAFQHPQDAMDGALPDEEIWVAEGTYTRRDSGDTVLLIMKDGLAVYGGFAGNETTRAERDWLAHVTALDGEDIVEHVVTGASGARLDGFTVTRGAAGTGDSGGGMLNSRVEGLVITNCAFIDNTAEWSGGGMRNSSSFLTVLNCTFSGNTSGGGAGMNNAYSSPLVLDCAFLDNVSTGRGGGLGTYHASPTIVGCTFSGNTAAENGGAIVSSTGSVVAVKNCSFSSNVAQQDGGAIWNYDSTATVVNCILWGDTAAAGAEIHNGGVFSCSVAYSDVEGGWSGTGNISGDPLFVDAANGDLHISAGSPCIDAADSRWALGTDIEGNPRVDDPGTPNTGVGPPWVDMGAYEYQP